MKIKVTDFATRHFDPKFGGTKIPDMTIEEFENDIALFSPDIEKAFELLKPKTAANHSGIIEAGDDATGYTQIKVHNGYAPFCKLVAIKNFTNARVGSLPIALDNYLFIKSGYSARGDNELPVFSRWLELPLGKPKAEWLMLVLYSKDHLIKEQACDLSANTIHNPIPDCDWGIVAILGQSHPNEEPMKPETILRNAGYNTTEFQKIMFEKIHNLVLEKDNKTEEQIAVEIQNIIMLQGILVGGSGVPLNKEKYLESVEFWEKNITLK